MRQRRKLWSFQTVSLWADTLWQWVRVVLRRAPFREARVVIDSTRAISTIPDVINLMVILIKQLHLLVPTARSAIFLLEGDQIRLVAAQGSYSSIVEIGNAIPCDMLPLLADITITRMPIMIPDVSLEPRWNRIPGSEYIQSWLGLPILGQDEVLGYLFLDRDTVGGFNRNEIDTVYAFCAQLGLALRLANLAVSREQQLASLAELSALSRTAGATFQLEMLLPELVRHLHMLVACSSCIMLLLDDDDQIVPVAAAGRLQDHYKTIELTPNELAFIHEIIQQQRPLSIVDPLDLSQGSELRRLSRARYWLGMPLLVQAEAIGIVLFGDEEQSYMTKQEGIQHAEVAVSHAALAIANSRLFEATQRHARELILRDRVRMAIAAAPLELDALAQHLTLSVAETFGYAHVSCWSLEQQQLTLLSASDPDYARRCRSFSLDDAVFAEVVGSGQPALIHHPLRALLDGDGSSKGRTEQVLSSLCVPVRSGDAIVVLFVVEHTQRLSERDLRMMSEIAMQVELAVEHIYLLKEVQRVQNDLAHTARMASIGTLAAGVAHEFNNMLATMVGYAQLGLVGSHDEQIEALQMVLTMAQRGKHITSSLLTFAESESGRRATMKLDELIDQALETVERDLNRLGIQLQRERNEQAIVAVDPAQFVQVIINLLTNARDAMSDGGILKLRTRVIDQRVELQVSDTGTGISPTVRGRLFEPFVTTKGALGGGQQSGIGLGLSICYSIVQGHGGTIDVQSVEGGGSTFIVTLPLYRSLELAAQQQASQDFRSAWKVRILVVDNDSLNQALLRSLFTREGYNVVLASGLENARMYIQQSTINVIFCSQNLGGADGMQFAEQLYAEGWRLPFVLMVGRIDDNRLQADHPPAITAILSKPFQPPEVLSLLQKVLNNSSAYSSDALD